MNYIPPFIFIFIGFLIMLRVKMRMDGHGYKKKFDDFLKDEEEANSVIKRNLDGLSFISANLNNLPIVSYDDNFNSKVKEAQELVLKKSELKMVRLDKNNTNLELKRKYGVNNLEKIIMYEEHYYMYIKSLNKWAKALIKEERYQEAEKVLMESFNFGSDFFDTYHSLVEIYKIQNNSAKIKGLRKLIEEKDFGNNQLLKERVLNYIDKNIL